MKTYINALALWSAVSLVAFALTHRVSATSISVMPPWEDPLRSYSLLSGSCASTFSLVDDPSGLWVLDRFQSRSTDVNAYLEKIRSASPGPGTDNMRFRKRSRAFVVLSDGDHLKNEALGWPLGEPPVCPVIVFSDLDAIGIEFYPHDFPVRILCVHVKSDGFAIRI